MEGIPLVESGRRDSRSRVIGVLAREFPLSLKEIHARCRKEGAATTYQAMHKAVKQLAAEGVVERRGLKYALSQKWLGKARVFVEQAHNKYGVPPRPSLLEIAPDSTATAEFNDSWVAAFYWLLGEMLTYSKARQFKKVSYIAMNGAWPVVVVGREQYLQIQELMRIRPTRIVCNTNGFIDQLILSFWKERFGTPYASGVACAHGAEQVVLDDFVIQIINPKEINDWWTKSLLNKVLDLKDLYKKAFESKTKVRVVITRNALLADQLRREFGRQFEKRNTGG